MVSKVYFKVGNYSLFPVRPLCEREGLQMNWLQVPDGPAKCPLMRRAQLNQRAHYIVAVRMAPDQNGPAQNGLKQMLRPQPLPMVVAHATGDQTIVWPNVGV